MSATLRERQARLIDQLRIGSADPSRADFVPIRADYRSDPARCLTAVAFVPDSLTQAIEQRVVAPLRRLRPEHYYYPRDSMHVTIKNVRVIHDPPRFTPADVAEVDQLFGRLLPRHSPFTVQFEEVVPFTTSVAFVAYCDQRMIDLIQDLDDGLKQIGLADDKRYVSDDVFFANITLCRYVRAPDPELLTAIRELAVVYTTEMAIESVALISCNAACSPETCRRLHSYRLGRG